MTTGCTGLVARPPHLGLDVHHLQLTSFFFIVSGRHFLLVRNEPLHYRCFCTRLACWSRYVVGLRCNVLHDNDMLP